MATQAAPCDVTVVGLDGRPLAEPALAALAKARFVAGWPRHVELVRHLVPPAAELHVATGDLPALLDAVRAAPRPAAVLASGDPGCFGIVRALGEAVGPVAVVPAISSVAQAFAAAGLSWDDAHVVSAHGREPHRAVAVCRRFAKVAVLTAPGFGPAALGAALAGLGKRLVVAERLGHPDERVTETSAEDAAGRDWADPNVVVVRDRGLPAGAKGWSAPPRWTPTSWALAEDAFAHRSDHVDDGRVTGMVTKAEVRALALAWLGPGLGDLVWDVGAGSGAVGVECAALGAAVIAVERDAGACRRVRHNATRHGVPVEVVEGTAPGALAGLPDPDAVFIGGGGPAVAVTAAERARRVAVVALATLERVADTTEALAARGLEVDATLLQASRLAPLAGGHRLAAVNPVVLVRARWEGGGP